MSTATSITVRVPLKIRRRPGRKTVVMPVHPAGADTAIPTRADPALLKALARAFRYQRLLDDGQYGSVSELAAAEKLERGHVGSILRLTLLAPDLVQAVLDGRQAEGVSLARLQQPFPLCWQAQQAALRSASTGAAPAVQRLGVAQRDSRAQQPPAGSGATEFRAGLGTGNIAKS